MAKAKRKIEAEVETSIRRFSGVLAAVSGGIDSVVMLHSLHIICSKWKINLEVAHLDHNLRKNSSKDRIFVEKLCKKYGLVFHYMVAADKPAKSNLESWAREQRYKFLYKVREQRKLDKIVTAHHADDISETLLIKLLSNKELTTIEFDDPKRSLIRPLLKIPKSVIIDYAKRNKLKYVFDESNDDLKILRNKIRKKLIPYISKNFNHRAVESLVDLALGVDQDIKALRGIAAQLLKGVSEFSFGSKEWLRELIKLLGGYPEAIQWRISEEVLSTQLGFRVGRKHANLFLRFILDGLNGVELMNGVNFKRSKGGIIKIR